MKGLGPGLEREAKNGATAPKSALVVGGFLTCQLIRGRLFGQHDSCASVGAPG